MQNCGGFLKYFVIKDASLDKLDLVKYHANINMQVLRSLDQGATDGGRVRDRSCSLFSVLCSLFSVPCYRFSVPCSLFLVPYTIFPVPCLFRKAKNLLFTFLPFKFSVVRRLREKFEFDMNLIRNY